MRQVYTCLEQMKNYRIVNGEVLMMNCEWKIIHYSNFQFTIHNCKGRLMFALVPVYVYIPHVWIIGH
jgi:hypothetical protein